MNTASRLVMVVALALAPALARAQAPDVAPSQPEASPTPAPDAPGLSICATAGKSGGAIPGATVIVLLPDGRASAATAGSDGCAFVAVGPGTYKVTVLAPGTNPKDLRVTLTEGQRLTKKVSLEIVEAGGQEMTVEARREQVGETRHVIEPEIARTLPGTQGDALKAVQNLPGTARAPFGAGALIVRGGAPEDTRVFLDGQEIPQLYHFGGLTSVVATEALSSIDFLPGGFGVRYGRALSGVVDVETRGAHADRRSGMADVNVYNTELEAEGPVVMGRAADPIAAVTDSTSGELSSSTPEPAGEPRYGRVLAAARRSYIDAVLPLVVPADVLAFTVAPRYYDYQLRYDSPSLAHGIQGHVLLYGSDDAFIFVIKKPQGDTAQVRGRFLFHTLFHRVQVPITAPLPGGWVVTATPGLGYQKVEFVAGSIGDAIGDRTDLTARVEARGPIGSDVRLLVGTDSQTLQNHYVVHFPDVDNRNGAGIDPQREISAADRYPSDQLSAFAEATWTLRHGLTLIPGVRVDGFLPTGAISVDPRLAFRFEPDKRQSYKAYLGLYHQPPQFQEWDKAIGNPDLRIPWAFQAGAGAARQLNDSTRLEGELFWKWMGDLVTARPGDISNPSSRSIYTNEGIGRAYGMEVLLRRELSEKLYGWIAYTLSRSERADPYTAGGWYPFTFDQTHILTLVAGWKLPRGWEAGTRFRYTTGNPDSGVAGAIYDSDRDAFVPIPGRTNRQRVPDFHQLDVRFDKRWDFKHWKLAAYLDVQNAYVHQNPEGVRYSFDYEQKYYITGLPFLPSLGLRGEF